MPPTSDDEKGRRVKPPDHDPGGDDGALHHARAQPAVNDGAVPPAPAATGRKLVRRGVYLLAGLVVLAAVALVGLRLLLPELGHYRPEIEAWLSRATERQVEIGAIDARWRGWTPVFRIRDVRLAGGGTSAGGAPADASVRLAALTFSLDPIDLFRPGALQPRELSASGASFVVVRRSDGTFAVAGLGRSAADGARGGGHLAQWMLSRSELSLLASRIVWIDERLGLDPLSLDDVTLRLERTADQLRILGSFEPSDAGRIDLAMEVTGDPLAASWAGRVHLAARDVDLSRLPGSEPREPGTFSGVVSGDVWSTWKDGRPVEATGTVRARSPGVVHMGRRRGLDEASASFRIERTPEGWMLAARDVTVTTPHGSWPAADIDARWRSPVAGRDGVVVLSAERARIEDLVALAIPDGPPAAQVPSAVAATAAHGVVEDLRVSAPVTEDRIGFEHFRASGRFTGLGFGPKDGPVTVEEASGRFEASGRGMIADIDAGRLRIDVPDRLAQPLRGEKLTGTLTATATPAGVRVRFDEASLETAAGTVNANGSLLAPRDGADPELDITLSLGASRIAAFRDHVAALVMPEPALRWIEAAAPFGDVREARLAFRGRLSDIVTSEGSGTVEATAGLFVPVLSYARGWPEITGVSAEVRFLDGRLDVRVESARILDSAIREARAVIEDVNAEVPVARAEGRIEGTSASAVRFLAESPLRARFAPMIDAFEIHGDSSIDLEVEIPLDGQDRPVVASGRIALEHNRIEGPGLGDGLTAVNGPIAFGSAGVESDGVTALWLGEPVHAVLGTAPETPDATRVTVRGRLNRRVLAAYLHDAGLLDTPAPEGSALLARVRGDAAWTATLDIPATQGTAPPALRIASDLTGLALDLPPPLGKARGTTRMLRIDSRGGSESEHVTEIRLGFAASAVLRLVRDTGRLRLERGAIRIGGSRAMLPDVPGVTVHGEVPALDTGAWQTLFEDISAMRPPGPDAPRPTPLREVMLDAGSVAALGIRFPETRMRAARAAQHGWRIDLEGPRLRGSVHLPHDLDSDPVAAEFERFVYEPDSGDTGNAPAGIDPRTLPALTFSARHFLLGEHDLGEVAFTTAPSERGLDITELQVRADSLEGTATGSWSLAGGKHLTEFAVQVHGDDLRRMLETVGFEGSVVAGGTTDVTLRGSLAGAPSEFAVDRLTGVMHFLSIDGRLTQIEPGVTGHVFGLLTITSLPRRLLLDFGDLFREGLGYDRIEGSFAIENGNAYTSDLYVESDTARIEVVGRTGLARRDYDQIVTVIPKISSTLPLVPIWIAQKIADHNLFDKAFAYQYTIEGTWNEPDIELVRAEKREDTLAD